MRSASLPVLIFPRALRWALLGGLIAIWAVHSPKRATAQQPTLRFERLTIEQGLSRNDVYSLLQNRAGFIWIGTADGLNRYDGYRFTSSHIRYRARPLSVVIFHPAEAHSAKREAARDAHQVA